MEWIICISSRILYVLNKLTGGTIDLNLENGLPLMADVDDSIEYFFDAPLKACVIQDLFIIKNEEK